MNDQTMNDLIVRAEVISLIQGGQAHVGFDAAVENFPEDKRGMRVNSLPYSAWQLLEHIRIAQRDILDWCRNTDGKYRKRKWPEEYWPKESSPADASEWDESVAEVKDDRDHLCEMVRTGNLTALLPWSKDHTLLREALLVADHTGYHTGEIVALRRLLGCWK